MSFHLPPGGPRGSPPRGDSFDSRGPRAPVSPDLGHLTGGYPSPALESATSGYPNFTYGASDFGHPSSAFSGRQPSKNSHYNSEQPHFEVFSPGPEVTSLRAPSKSSAHSERPDYPFSSPPQDYLFSPSPQLSHARASDDEGPMNPLDRLLGSHKRVPSGSDMQSFGTPLNSELPSVGRGPMSPEASRAVPEDSMSAGHRRVKSHGDVREMREFGGGHQRTPSGSSHSRRSSAFGHQRVPSHGSSQSSGVHKSIMTPRHASSRTMFGYYDILSELGKGSFGLVQLVSDRATSQQRVCKTVNTADLQSGVLDMVRKEVELLRTLDHPHVVKLFEYVEDYDRKEILLILEYVPGGSCQELIRRSMFSLSEALVSRLIYQVLAAVAYCHAQGVAHRDVKPEHMMLTQVGLWGHPNCKLIDFGLAAMTAEANSRDFVGTPEYMAPEVISLQTTDASKTDIWSIGISTIEMLTGKSPFGKPIEYGSNDPVYANVQSYNTFRDIEPTLEEMRGWQMRSSEAQDFAYWLLVKDPAMRPTAIDAHDHPWMQTHRAKRTSLTRDMLRSMEGYIGAHPLVRCCLLVVAARMDVPDHERLEAAFLSLDSDCDGEISKDDLAAVLAKPAEWWDTENLMGLLKGSPDFNASDLVAVADLDQSGGLCFTEFVATCLYSKQDSALPAEALVRRAFEALDDDRDGYVHARDVYALFQEHDFSRFPLLPQDKPISVSEWCALFNDAFTQPTYQRKVVVRKKKKGWC